jgi:small subunit ribosomal protein S3
LQTLRADIDYGCSEAFTTYGVIGVKCWIYKGDILDHKQGSAMGAGAEDLEPARRREARSVAERERERIRSRPAEHRPEGMVPAPPPPPSAPQRRVESGPAESGAPVRPPLSVPEAPAAGGAEGTAAAEPGEAEKK